MLNLMLNINFYVMIYSILIYNELLLLCNFDYIYINMEDNKLYHHII